MVACIGMEKTPIKCVIKIVKNTTCASKQSYLVYYRLPYSKVTSYYNKKIAMYSVNNIRQM